MKICQGCSGSFLKFPEAWILFPVYLSRLWHQTCIYYFLPFLMPVKIGLFFFSFWSWWFVYTVFFSFNNIACHGWRHGISEVGWRCSEYQKGIFSLFVLVLFFLISGSFSPAIIEERVICLIFLLPSLSICFNNYYSTVDCL